MFLIYGTSGHSSGTQKGAGQRLSPPGPRWRGGWGEGLKQCRHLPEASKGRMRPAYRGWAKLCSHSSMTSAPQSPVGGMIGQNQIGRALLMGHGARREALLREKSHQCFHHRTDGSRCNYINGFWKYHVPLISLLAENITCFEGESVYQRCFYWMFHECGFGLERNPHFQSAIYQSKSHV